MYSAGESATIVGQTLEGRRDDAALAIEVHCAVSEETQPD